MHFDTHTIYMVTKRLVDLAEKPPLFHERVTPATIVKRLDRVLDWLGTGGRVIVSDYIRRRDVPKPGGKKQWTRGDYGRPNFVETRMV